MTLISLLRLLINGFRHSYESARGHRETAAVSAEGQSMVCCAKLRDYWRRIVRGFGMFDNPLKFADNHTHPRL